METKFYVDKGGNYLGGFAGAEPPEGATEVPSAPDNASDKWVDGVWVKSPETNAQEQKAQKEHALANIKVTVNGKEFDGHESARLNMTNALMVASFTGQTQTNWKLADNTVAQVTIADVQQALALSIQKVGEIIGAV